MLMGKTSTKLFLTIDRGVALL